MTPDQAQEVVSAVDSIKQFSQVEMTSVLVLIGVVIACTVCMIIMRLIP